MKAIVKATGRIVDVMQTDARPITGFQVMYCDVMTGRYYALHDLDFDIPDINTTNDPRIPLAQIREVLDMCVKVGYINEYVKQGIEEIIKQTV